MPVPDKALAMKKAEEFYRMVDKSFEDIWPDEKENVRLMSQKDTAAFFFGMGMATAMEGLSMAINELDDKAKKTLYSAAGKASGYGTK